MTKKHDFIPDETPVVADTAPVEPVPVDTADADAIAAAALANS